MRKICHRKCRAKESNVGARDRSGRSVHSYSDRELSEVAQIVKIGSLYGKALAFGI